MRNASPNRLNARAYRGRILHALSREELVYLPDGGLLVNDEGFVEACADWNELEAGGKLAGYEITTLPPHCLIIPGLIDLHVHLPQLEATGCQEADLLTWLERHIYPAEARFADEAHARTYSRWFFEELLRNGATTAAVFLTTHDKATRIAFETAEALGNRVIMGQNLMDCNAPSELMKPAAQMLAETEAHCQQWHGADNGRIAYAWMPRFAITSSEELLEGLGQLRKRYPDVYLHTHLSEQTTEIQAVCHQFPWTADYTQVYERFGLLGPKTILAHGIHLSDSELDRIQDSQSALAHCPGSNFFLKSGRFRLFEILKRQILLGFGSDVGAGPELSLFKAMKDAQYMQGEQLVSVRDLFYTATLGGAKALFLADRIGNFMPGKDADFLILDCAQKPAFLPPADSASVETLEALVSKLVYLGDDRLVSATYVRGRQVYTQSTPDTALKLTV